MNIPLGYEIGTGKRVAIPVNHTVVLGQTQLSGKTTTLEAMVARSGLRAIGFITKPGEKSFRLQREIPAFFLEAPLGEYWRYVASILEYHSGSRLGFRERGALIKLCQEYKKALTVSVVDKKTGDTKKKRAELEWDAPRTLEELLANIEEWLPHTRNIDEMICMQLREYLRPAIQEIAAAKFSSRLDLAPGINVMDLTGLSDGLQALVIRSVIDQVHRRSRKTVVIIPEAWKFIPEGRTTPVKLALEGLIREGAGVENFVWMDSQDLRGVDKLLLRSVIVWLFGVQRQKNEVASTLASIPDSPKPTATEIMQLGKGQFYVCWGTNQKLTYVQPAGMEDVHAQAIALGEESPDSWRSIERALDITKTKEGIEAPDAAAEVDLEAQAPQGELRRDVFLGAGRERDAAPGAERSASEIQRPGSQPAENDYRPDARPIRMSNGPAGPEVSQAPEGVSNSTREDLSDERSPDAGNVRTNQGPVGSVRALREPDAPRSAGEAESSQREATGEGSDFMPEETWREKYEQLLPRYEELEKEHQTLIYAHDALARRVLELEKRSPSGAPAGVMSAGAGEDASRSLGAFRGAQTPGESRPSAGGRDGHPADTKGAARSSRAAPFQISPELLDSLYHFVKARALADAPRVLEILIARPELRVRVERETICAEGSTLRGALGILISESFFKNARKFDEVRRELIRRGFLGSKAPNRQISRAVIGLVENQFLTSEDEGYREVPGMKVHIIENGAKKMEARA